MFATALEVIIFLLLGKMAFYALKIHEFCLNKICDRLYENFYANNEKTVLPILQSNEKWLNNWIIYLKQSNNQFVTKQVLVSKRKLEEKSFNSKLLDFEFGTNIWISIM